jgi:hypothetical protein
MVFEKLKQRCDLHRRRLGEFFRSSRTEDEDACRGRKPDDRYDGDHEQERNPYPQSVHD